VNSSRRAKFFYYRLNALSKICSEGDAMGIRKCFLVVGIINLTLALPAISESSKLTLGKDQPNISSLTPLLLAKGYSSAACERLFNSGLVKRNANVSECNSSDAQTLEEKYLLADQVILGEVIEVAYLYKEGGPFRTLYTLRVDRPLKGSPATEVRVLSQFGPNSKDHRRWKSHPTRFELETGDKGLFFLESSKIETLADAQPRFASGLRGKHTFLSDIASGTFIIENGDFDREFLKKSGKRSDLDGLQTALARFEAIEGQVRGGK
jgi:hypothetical protein